MTTSNTTGTPGSTGSPGATGGNWYTVDDGFFVREIVLAFMNRLRERDHERYLLAYQLLKRGINPTVLSEVDVERLSKLSHQEFLRAAETAARMLGMNRLPYDLVKDISDGLAAKLSFTLSPLKWRALTP
jgi:hypothetical protein